jgi:hypothetical protein
VNKNFKKGDFVFLPASTLMFKFKENGADWVEASRSLEEPLYLPYIGRNNCNASMCLVFFDGSVWSVPEKNVYEGVKCE